MAAPLTVLFNKSLDKGVLPSEWKLAEIVAIFKKGKKTSPNNYRPVSLTCILCKVLESFVRDVVQNHMEHFKLYCKCQHGFRKGRSCITQLLNVMNDFSNYINDGKMFDVIYQMIKKKGNPLNIPPFRQFFFKFKIPSYSSNIVKGTYKFKMSGR